MAEFRQVPGGRETPQGELWSQVVEDEVPRSPVAEESGRGGSNSSETKLSPREEEELDPRIQVRKLKRRERQGAQIPVFLKSCLINERLELLSHQCAGAGKENKFVSKSL